MNTIHVTREQLTRINAICDAWDGSKRWIPELDQYLMEEDIRPTEDASPSWPSGYRFLAGGVDHIVTTQRSTTIHDRGLAGVDGTTKFVGS